ncbi:MAG TPA: MBL fold metallo-hydrolase [Bacteroidota bacterium]|nr:MBL fold metallo-hydrolase [Bacteroidota bacterium]
MIKMLIAFFFALTMSATAFEKDVIKTSAGDVEITFIGHASLMMTHDGKTIFIDPFGKLADYTQFPKADLILITHDHPDHLDTAVIGTIRKSDTQIIANEAGAKEVEGAVAMKNGDSRTVDDIKIEAVPAYNIKHTRDNGAPFHPKGEGNGYVLTFGGTRIYIAGDTEGVPEMADLKDIDIAFLPMNLPYTMTPDETATAARSFKPKILYPYHTGDTDTQEIVRLLRDTPEIEVRIRPMK